MTELPNSSEKRPSSFISVESAAQAATMLGIYAALGSDGTALTIWDNLTHQALAYGVGGLARAATHKLKGEDVSILTDDFWQYTGVGIATTWTHYQLGNTLGHVGNTLTGLKHSAEYVFNVSIPQFLAEVQKHTPTATSITPTEIPTPTPIPSIESHPNSSGSDFFNQLKTMWDMANPNLKNGVLDLILIGISTFIATRKPVKDAFTRSVRSTFEEAKAGVKKDVAEYMEHLAGKLRTSSQTNTTTANRFKRQGR